MYAPQTGVQATISVRANKPFHKTYKSYKSYENIAWQISASPYLSVLRVSPKAIARAFKSFHSLLTLNTEYGGQWRIAQAIIYNSPKILSASPYLSVLRVSPKATATAFNHFHSLLTLNTDTRSVIFTEVRRKSASNY